MTDSKVIGLLEQILSRLSVLEAKVGSGGGGGAGDSSNGGGAELPRSVRAFDEFTASFLDPFVAASAKLGGEAASGGVIVKEGFDELRKVLLMAAACKEPTPAALPGVVAGINGKLKAASQNIKRNEWEKHAKTISEGIGCLSWVMVKPAPRDFIETFIGASDYWANGIRKEFRTTNPDQIAFCDTFKALIQELAKYVKEHHTTGLAWNKAGQDTAEWKGDATPAPTPATSSTAAAKPAATAPAKSATAPTANLFAELNKEGAITSGLKKVTKDMQTWRAEYKGGDAKPSAAPAPAKPVANSAAANQPKGPAKLEFNATAAKWVVENQGTTPEPIAIEIKDKRETVYLFGCVGATVSVKGKCKSIVIDSCKKTTLYFEVAMASVEVVNSQRMNVHVLQSVSSVAIDKTDGIVVHLPASSLTTEIVASKSSEMNVSFPDESGELIERPIPEQYVHRIKGTQITADVSDLYSH